MCVLEYVRLFVSMYVCLFTHECVCVCVCTHALETVFPKI